MPEEIEKQEVKGKKKKKAALPIPAGLSKATGLPDALLKSLASVGALPAREHLNAERLQTGSLAFDYMLGGGLPIGHYFTIVGDTGVGKTTTMLMAAANVIEQGGRVAWFDMEQALELDWVERLGVDPEMLQVYQPELGEEMMEAIRILIDHSIETGEPFYKLIIIDSVAAVKFRAETEGSMDDNQMALGARQWSKFLKLIMNKLRRSGMCIGLINQLRDNPGAMFGPTETEPGGRAIRFYATIRIKMLAAKPIEGSLTKIFRPKTVKNRTAPLREGDMKIDMNGPLVFADIVPELTNIGLELGVFQNSEGFPKADKGGAWYFDGKRIGEGTGEPSAILALYKDIDLQNRVEASIREIIAELNKKSPSSGLALESDNTELSDESDYDESEKND